MAASGSRPRITDMCIIHTCIIYIYQNTCILDTSYKNVSGSRVMDKCIIGVCIMVTCIRIKNICIAHQTPRITLSVGPFVRNKICRIIHTCNIHTCFRIKVQDHGYVHHTHMHHSQGLRNIDICITHTCIRTRVMDMCIMHTCIIVKDRGT